MTLRVNSCPRDLWAVSSPPGGPAWGAVHCIAESMAWPAHCVTQGMEWLAHCMAQGMERVVEQAADFSPAHPSTSGVDGFAASRGGGRGDAATPSGPPWWDMQLRTVTQQ